MIPDAALLDTTMDEATADGLLAVAMDVDVAPVIKVPGLELEPELELETVLPVCTTRLPEIMLRTSDPDVIPVQAAVSLSLSHRQVLANHPSWKRLCTSACLLAG